MDKREAALKQLLRALSPIGAKEYIDTADGTDYIPRSAVAATRGENIYYRPHVKDDFTVREHERIHVGQNRLEKNLTPEEILKIFPEEAKRLDASDMTPREIVLELPAYGIGGTNMPFDWKNYSDKEKTRMSQILQKERFAQAAKYINELKRRNSGDRGIATIEAALAGDFLKMLTQQNPPPVRNPKVPGLWGK